MLVEVNSTFDDMTGAEKEVAQLLTTLGIWWNYEQPLYVSDEKERPRVWTPDFYLPELGIYVEVCGKKETDYTYREKIYKKNRIPIIFVHTFKEKDRWTTFLIKEIENFQKQRLTLIETMQNKAKNL